MKKVELRSKKVLRRYKCADKVCREFRFLIVKDGMVNGLNSDRIMKLFFAWMSAAGKDAFARPAVLGRPRYHSTGARS